MKPLYMGILLSTLIALPVIDNTASAKSKAELADVFHGDMLGVTLEYFESKVGPAKTRYDGEYSYTVEGCSVGVFADEGTINALSLDLTSECNADLSTFIGDLAPAEEKKGLISGLWSKKTPLTFGSFQAAAGFLQFYSDCLTMCGNSHDPSIYALWEGPRSTGFIQVVLETPIVSDPIIDASNKWEALMVKERGKDWVTENKFNCDRSYDRPAQAIFSDIEPAKVTVGHYLRTPDCYQ